MSEFLTEVSTTTTKRSKDPSPLIQEVQTSTPRPSHAVVDSPESALEALKIQPDPETVKETLSYLATESDRKDGFSLISPEPISANIAYQLVNTTIPDYWRILKSSVSQSKQLVRCLQNPCGVGAILTHLRPLIIDCREKKQVNNTRDPSEHIQDLLSVLEKVMGDSTTSNGIWTAVRTHAKNTVQKKLMWKEFVTQIASGRILSVSAEAEDALKSKAVSEAVAWLANGAEYAEWLGRNIATMIIVGDKDEDTITAVVELCSKALTLGYTDHVVKSILLLIINDNSIAVLESILMKMRSFEQRKYLNAALAFIVKQYFTLDVITKDATSIQSSKSISGAARLVFDLTKGSDLLKDHIVSALTKSAIPALDGSLGLRRSVLAALAQDEDKIQNLFENSLKLFGDPVYIKHTPILQQEVLAQTLALTCGYIQRSQPMFLTLMAKSTYHINGMSNRIGASSPRARFLGIAVGTAISRMVDKPDLQLKFELEGNESTEADWYQLLTTVDDKLGRIEDLKISHKTGTSPKRANRSSKPSKGSSTAPAITEIKGPRIVEVLSSSEDEDDDLIAYDKPDTDPEDETDDPTAINRNKPTAPVYIRDLIIGLRDQENYERHQLALSTSASLIRRKANFGSEVTDHIEELATVLTGLSDNLDLEQFTQQRQQALVAILLAKPARMAQWFATSFFTGDYSLTQRIAMLTTLGLGARELAGLKDDSTSELVPPKSSFPSKQLPPNLHKIYASETLDPVSKITDKLSKQLLSPMATQAADSLTGPSVLKVRHFSTRMEVEQRRSKPIPNALAQIVAENFFFPLTGRWWLQVRAAASKNDSIYTSTHLLPAFLHTLALLLHASGPNTLALPQMTREFWDLLLAVRTLALNDKAILGATLFALLMLLETNENKERLATEQGKELLETQEWVRMVFEGLGAGSDEDERVRVLAAGVVVRCQETVEKYQRRLVGSMMDY